MNFTSQICTTREQSERLLALGLKTETADCSWNTITLHGTPITYPSQDSWLDHPIISDNHFPSWSLHRLIEISDMGIMDSSTDNIYDKVIQYIEFLIKCGDFNKEYLEE